MKRYQVRFSKIARRQLEELYDYIALHADPETALRFVERIEAFCFGLETFPERGTLRADIRPGLRLVGFERRTTIAFTLRDEQVNVLQILYAGRQLE